MTLAIIVLSAIVGTYIYVMVLCYLCDLYEQKKLAKRQAEEKRHKERRQHAIHVTEMRRKQELERRRQLAEARRRRGGIRTGKPPHRPVRPEKISSVSP